jgi:hypothetical protein
MSNITRIRQMVDGNGIPILGLNFPGWIDHLVLVADTAQDYTIPTGARNINIISTGDFWVRAEGAAAIPTGAVTNGSGSLLNPGIISVVGITTLSFIAAADCKIAIAVYN